MAGEHLTNKNTQNLYHTDVRKRWLNWCRLCAKSDLDGEESSSIFVENEAGKLESDLATSIGKYFWVNIKADDEISLCVCLQCKQLLQELVVFTERVNKVQTLFCLLQNIKPQTMVQALALKKQCGLFDEEWQHIIKQQIHEQTPAKPLLIDQQIQTDDLIVDDDEHVDDENTQEKYAGTEEIINILRSPGENEDCENQTEAEVEQVYEYVEQSENDNESSEYIGPTNNVVIEEKKQNTTEFNEDGDEISDSDTLQEFKDKDIENERKRMIVNEEDIDVEYENSEEHLKQAGDDDEDDGEHSIEMLEDEDDVEYINTGENAVEANIEALYKGKRGRPFGVKNSLICKYRFECKECKRTYKNPNIYRKHMSDLHGVDVDNIPNCTTCSICNKQFTTQSSLKLHMRHHLPDDEKFIVPCPYCGRKFSQVGAMRQHVKGIHHQVKPYVCDQCGRACKTMAALNEHLLVHTNECPFECEVCHKRFKNKPRLKTHMDIHNKSVYKCEDCGLELNTKRTLLQHRLVHSDVKRFKCEFCDAAFKRSKALKNHLILHSGLRPYKCNFCSKSFSNGSNCRAHKKRTHPKELAEEEANGKEPERVPIPKIEELKTAKSVLVQPRKIKRHEGGLPSKLRKLLKSSETIKTEQGECHEYEDAAENYEAVSDYQYEIYKTEIESLADTPGEECEETVIYEIIDEI